MTKAPIKLCLLAALLTGCASSPEVAETTAPEPVSAARALADDYESAWLDNFPENATLLGLPGARHSRLTDASPEALLEWQQTEDSYLQAAEDLASQLEPGTTDWLIVDTLRTELKAAIDVRACRSELWALNQVSGWQVYLPEVFRRQPVFNAEFELQTLERLRALAGVIRRQQANLELGLMLRLPAPRRNAELVLAQVEQLLAEETFLLASRRSSNPLFQVEYRKIYLNRVEPALTDYIDYLRNTYLPSARDTLSISSIPGGNTCYLASFAQASQAGLSPADASDAAKELIADVTSELDELAVDAFGLSGHRELLETVTTDPRFALDTEQDILTRSRAAMDRGRLATSQVVTRTPEIPVVIRPASAAPGQLPVSIYQPAQGDTPAVWLVPVWRPDLRPEVTLEYPAFAETWPGRHLQMATAMTADQPVRAAGSVFDDAGYTEGWALYATTLADELNLYSTPADRVGMLNDLLTRAALLIADDSIHRLGQDRATAEAFLLETTVLADIDIITEIDRMAALPGQVGAGIVARQAILRLRESSPDQRAFHDALLETGAIPLVSFARKPIP